MNGVVSLKDIWNGIIRFTKRTSNNHVSAYAAQSAYFVILSFIPFLILLVCFLRHIPGVQSFAADTIVNSVPAEAQFMVRGIIDEVYVNTRTVVPITILVAIWSSAKGFQALTNGLNVINGVSETRNYLYMRLRSALCTIIFLVSIIITLLLMVFGRSIQQMLAVYWPFVAQITNFILRFSTLITMCWLALVFLLLYTYLPNKKQKLKEQIPGALAASVSWTLFSFGFSFYFTHFSEASNIYGSLTAVVLVMLWLYICMILFMVGAEINQWLEEK